MVPVGCAVVMLMFGTPEEPPAVTVPRLICPLPNMLMLPACPAASDVIVLAEVNRMSPPAPALFEYAAIVMLPPGPIVEELTVQEPQFIDPPVADGPLTLSVVG